MSQIIPTAEPFFFPGDSSKPACLLTHGFTGVPKEMRLMGEFLHKHGYACLGIRLSGHGTNPEDMIRSRYQDWMASVEDGYHLLRGISDRIVFIGLSMGGVLSLLMSTRLDVLGVTAISTPYKLKDDPRLPYVSLISWFKPYMSKSKERPGTGWFDQDAWKDHISYPQNPVRALGELNKLTAELRKALPLVKVPLLLIHSRDDSYVPPENMESIYAALKNAPDKKKVYLTGSGHVVTKDAAREQAFQLTLNFIQHFDNSNH